MTFVGVAQAAVMVALTGVLAWAAVNDVRVRKIPNAAVLAVLALYLPWAFLHPPSAALSALAAGGLALVVCFLMYCFRIVGAGDAKLFSAVAVFGGMKLLPGLALATVLAGGAIVLVRLAIEPRRALLLWHMRGRLDDGRGVPYGLAIALGAVAVFWTSRFGVLPKALALTY